MNFLNHEILIGLNYIWIMLFYEKDEKYLVKCSTGVLVLDVPECNRTLFLSVLLNFKLLFA